MSVIVAFGLNVFNEKIEGFEEQRSQYQEKKKKNPKRSFKIETQEKFYTITTLCLVTTLVIFHTF